MRINKFLASCGVASRRHAEEYITSGKVTVNGVVLTDLAYDVKDSDQVCVNGKAVTQEVDKEYYLLNKPQGYLCTVSDDRGRKTVMDLMRGIKVRIFPVGRLDYNTQGMLVLTNDGEFANYMTHPKNEVTKTYEVKTKYELSPSQIRSVKEGVDVGDFVTGKAQVEMLGADENGKYHTLITIHEGKNREIRRMFEKLGLQILQLKRVAIGSYVMKDLPLGKYKKLSKKDLELMKQPRDI